MNPKKACILVVDDLPDWRRTLAGVLEDQQYEVCTAASAAQALALIETTPIDLALLDIRLDESDEGNIDGLHLAAQIKERWPRVKVIMITGYDRTEYIDRALQADLQGKRLASDFVLKAQTDKLAGVVERVLQATG